MPKEINSQIESSQMTNSISLNSNLNNRIGEDFQPKITSSPKTPSRIYNSQYNTSGQSDLQINAYGNNYNNDQRNMFGYGIEKCGPTRSIGSKFLSKSPYAVNNFNKNSSSGSPLNYSSLSNTSSSGLFERKGTSRNSFSKRYLNNLNVSNFYFNKNF